MFGYIGAAILYVVLVGMFLIAKNQSRTPGFNSVDLHLLKRKMHQYKMLSIITAIFFILSASVAFGREYYAKSTAINFDHVHGIDFTNDDKLIVSTHIGILFYSKNTWKLSHLPVNDYMGFSLVDNGFYSSGHPGKGSLLPNPLGIIKVTLDGKVEPIKFSGTAVFHGLSAGFYTHVLYAYNTTPNMKIKGDGLYVSKDEAKTWSKCKLKGVQGDLNTFAASATQPNVIALGTNKGIFLSRDYGQTFKHYFSSFKVTSIIFEKNGDIIFGGITQLPILYKWNLTTMAIHPIPLPELDQGGIALIAASSNEREMAVVSFNNNIYYTRDQGYHWKLIAKSGETLN